ncbi:M56 family metallopeptidase [Mycolicibacterium arseniciresistens]|uniref:M56 family metallopeptidase n=1 Tax=Mycolicibacterium arseniciresistens TaxID=3062257 RepID=A0ABT8UG24_9MYCO|nr:M56 family metallopeptidase [Mycolicibacterium arseniciresistens]MDO3635338.1 M56 family metallopeptidase [Mycolicibacterium arseniciresistens]
MTTAMWLALYGGALAWLAPSVLRRMTSGGVSPHMGVAAWLVAIGATLIAWMATLALIIVAVAEGVHDAEALTLCLELFGFSDHTPLPGRIGSMAVITGGLLTLCIVAIRVCRSIATLRARSHEHAHAARIIGRPTGSSDVVVVDAVRPAAYCVIGRPNAIVVTSAAIDSLNRAQLEAVLAHEDAHISGRHHHILMVLRALAFTLPRIPLFATANAAVAELLEMCADDAAARSVGIRPLLGGLLTLAGHRAPLPEGLAAAGTAVLNRAVRLAMPTARHIQWRHRVALGAAMTLMLAAPALIQVLCHH